MKPVAHALDPPALDNLATDTLPRTPRRQTLLRRTPFPGPLALDPPPPDALPWTPCPGPPLRRTAQNFALFFFPLPPQFSFFFSLSGCLLVSFFLSGSSRGILVVFWSVGTSNVLVFALRLSCETPAAQILLPPRPDPDRSPPSRFRPPRPSHLKLYF